MRSFIYLLILLFLSQKCFSEDDLTIEEEEYYDDEEMEIEDEPEVETVQEPEYTPPSEVLGASIFENFQDEEAFNKRWTHSSNPSFSARFEVGTGGDNPSISAEKGLFVPREAQRYAIFGSLDEVFNFEEQNTFVVQYEVRLHNDLQCGGGYIKLASKQGEGWTAGDVTNETPYTVMFGPDKCGGTNKVHFIWRFQNPVSGEYEEHHLKQSPSPAGTSDRRSHLYTLVMRSDNSFEIFIDKTSQIKGDLLTDFEPPLVPPKQIHDPSDEKPEEWVDDAKIPDPDASKPVDWDEDAPRRIPDPEAEKPDGWNDDATVEIEDPDAQEPEDWDQEDDGEWEAPLIENPACSVGCGKWKAPMIDNPDFKGRWHAPMVDNPDYIGEWEPKQIDNPAYFEETTPFEKLDSVAGIVVDIWTMQRGIEYDNMYVGSSEDTAYELTKAWEIRHKFQNEAMKSSSPSADGESNETLGEVVDLVKDNWVQILATVSILVFTFVYFVCCKEDPVEQIPAAEEPVAEGPQEKEALDTRAKMEKEAMLKADEEKKRKQRIKYKTRKKQPPTDYPEVGSGKRNKVAQSDKNFLFNLLCNVDLNATFFG